MLTKNDIKTVGAGDKSRPWLKYVIAFAVAATISVLLMWYFGLFSGTFIPRDDLYKALSDSFFISGMLFLCVGGLVFVNRNGAFDGLVYAVKYVFTVHYNHKQGKKNESYYEYKQRKAAEEKAPCLFLVLTGLAFVLAATVCMLLFYKYFRG